MLQLCIPTLDTGRALRFEAPRLFNKVRDLVVAKRLFVPLVETQYFKVSKKAALLADFKSKDKAVRRCEASSSPAYKSFLRYRIKRLRSVPDKPDRPPTTCGWVGGPSQLITRPPRRKKQKQK